MSETEKRGLTRQAAKPAHARGPRRTRALAVALVVFVATGLLFAAEACLPDLAAIVEEPEAAIQPFHGCGDGLIASLDDGGDAGEACDPGPDDASIEASGCSADCQITCEPGGHIDALTGHCYFVPAQLPMTSSFRSAIGACGGTAHLVTFASDSEVMLVNALVGSSEYWVGLSLQTNVGGAYQASHVDEPGFPFPGAPDPTATGPCPGCFAVSVDPDSGLLPVTDAGETEPTDCIASRGGTWFQVPCFSKNNSGRPRTVVCEREPLGVRAQFSNDGLFFTVPQTAALGKAYLVVVSSTDPDTAAASCNSLDGGSLVVFESREEREQLAREIGARYPATEVDLWIGLRSDDAGSWAWEDGVIADAAGPNARPVPWGNAAPAQIPSARAYIRVGVNAYDTQLALADDGGGAGRLFICQRPVQ